MEQSSKKKSDGKYPLIIVLVGALLILAAILLGLYLGREDQEGETAGAPPSTSPPVASSSQPSPCVAPSFDVVRVNPQGDAVIAGRAPVAAKVTVLDGGQPVGDVTADQRGEWVFVPKQPLPPGSRTLSLRAELADCPDLPNSEDVVLVIPEQGKDVAGQLVGTGEQPGTLAVGVGKDGTPQLLQSPVGDNGLAMLTFDVVDYDGEGRLALAGKSDQGALVQVYLNNEFLGDGHADVQRNWSIKPDRRVGVGLYTLRADRLDADGKVVARVEIPFSRGELSDHVGPGEYVVVQPGQSLWRLARNNYGKGLRYTVIYDANEGQIRDPNLIFPGQILAVPKQ